MEDNTDWIKTGAGKTIWLRRELGEYVTIDEREFIDPKGESA